MRVINQAIETTPVSALVQHPRNANRGDSAAIGESIRENGFYGAIVAQRSTGYVLAGNHRLVAAQAAGATEVPVAWVDVDDEAALRILLADNRTTRLGEDDPGALADLLRELSETDAGLAGTGFDAAALDELLAELGLNGSGEEPGDDPGAQVDRAEELREKWGTERGQIWAIPSKTVPGKLHRLMCGDSTSAEDVGRLLGEAEPRLMVTDPPYGVEYDPTWRRDAGVSSNRNKMGKVLNDDRADWTEAWQLSPAAVAYVWHGALHAGTVQDSLRTAGFEVRSQIIWMKDRLVLGRGAYHWRHEPAWYAVRKGSAARFLGGRKQTTEWGGDMAARPSYEWLLGLWDDIKPATSVWEIPAREDSGHGHGTQKPVECMARPIRNHDGDVHEPFAGSGSTLVAAERERRTCYGMELDPGYVAVILERLTGMGLSPHRAIHDEAE